MFNPRYTEYARVHGKTEEEMLAYDKEQYPGGCMAGFVNWINDKWFKWKMLNNISKDFPLSTEHHDAFTNWLKAESIK
jgi:hypothetical protein